MGLQKIAAHDQVCGDELALGPEVPLVDEHLATAFDHEAAGPWLRHPRAIDLALLESSERLRVVLRQDVDVAAAGGVGRVSVALEKPAQRDVLRGAKLRIRDLLAPQVVN